MYFLLARYAAESVRVLCQLSAHNAMVCSVTGVFAKVVRILDKPEMDHELGGKVKLFNHQSQLEINC